MIDATLILPQNNKQNNKQPDNSMKSLIDSESDDDVHASPMFGKPIINRGAKFNKDSIDDIIDELDGNKPQE